jgi:hypothetical protein
MNNLFALHAKFYKQNPLKSTYIKAATTLIFDAIESDRIEHGPIVYSQNYNTEFLKMLNLFFL